MDLFRERLPRRVLMTADAVGGVWTYAVELSRALEAHRIEVVLATLGPAPSVAQKQALPPSVRLHVGDYRLEWMDEPWDDVARSGEWLLSLERRFAPDVIHLNSYAHGALPFRAPAIVVAHSCVVSWWEAVKGEPPPERYGRYRQMVRAGLDGARMVVAPTRAMLRTLVDGYGPLGHAAVISNGCHPGLFAERPKEPFILSAGRLWDAAKNLRALAAASRKSCWPIFIAGDESPPEGAPDAAPSLGSLFPLGVLRREELAAWLARAAIFALPARYEPFGLSALEAGLSGCALVLGDTASLREIWSGAADFVSPDDPAGLARALNRLIAEPGERVRLAARARARALDLNATRMGARYAMLYRSILGGNGRDPAPSLRSASSVGLTAELD
jgi:glycosyltransferase involved in cell wall biosynthesis